MKIFSSDQIKKADQYTIDHEPIASVDLMERAGEKLGERLLTIFPTTMEYLVFAGPGNNGGDGLVMARYLKAQKKNVKVYLLDAKEYSPELIHNIAQINKAKIELVILKNKEQVETLFFPQNAVFIDALFGNGLNRPLDGFAAELIKKINGVPVFKVSVDMPSGLSADAKHISTIENTVVANLTLAIQFPKFSFFFSENNIFTGKWEVINIDLSRSFIENEPTPFYCLEQLMINDLIHPRSTFAHKGTFGHALIIAGSKGKIGASILSGYAALKTGCGLLTTQVPSSGAMAMHVSLPEAMVIADSNADYISDKVKDVTNFNAVGFGPGVDKQPSTVQVLKMLIQDASQPLVIDADGLNILAENLTWLEFLNGSTILTPHPGEFDRLTKKHFSGIERFNTQLEFSKKHGVYIVLKGHHTSITTPAGLAFFNTTGNNGMATGGSGDALTGIITSLCAQGYSPLHASLLGVYLHGYAGDRAAEDESKTSLIASDIIRHIPTFFLQFEK